MLEPVPPIVDFAKVDLHGGSRLVKAPCRGLKPKRRRQRGASYFQRSL